jgi:hypothetical protein
MVSIAISQGAGSSHVTFEVGEAGEVSTKLDISSQSPSQSATTGVLLLVILPFSLDLNRAFVCADDVHVAELNRGKGYTFLAVTAPIARTQLLLEIKGATHISETPDGKGKLEIDVSLPYISLSDKELLALPFCIRIFDIAFVLPRRYDETDEYAFPSALNTKDNQTFEAKGVAIQGQSYTKLRVVFPNPVQHQLDLGQLVIGLVFGGLGILLQTGFLQLRERNPVVICIILGAALAVIVAAIFFTIGLPQTRKIQFLALVIFACLNALFAAFASGYVLLAKRFQAVVGGQVNLNDAPSQWPQVELHQIGSGMVKQTDSLKQGLYVFYLWRVQSSAKYQVIAKWGGEEGKSNEFELSRGKRKEVPVINLRLAPTPAASTSA